MEFLMTAAYFISVAGGIISFVGLPLLAIYVIKQDDRLDSLSESFEHRMATSSERQLHLEEVLARQDRTISAMYLQLDGIESDLERSRLSSIAGSTGTIKLNVSNKKKPLLDKIKKDSVNSEVKKGVYHLTNTKQGGKRANKSRNR